MVLDRRVKVTVSGFVGNISTTSDGVFYTCKTDTSNGGLVLISTEDTDSLTRLAPVNIKLPPPHSQNLQVDSSTSVQFFLKNKAELR